MSNWKPRFFAAFIVLLVFVASCATTRPIEMIWHDQSRIQAGQFGFVELGEIDTSGIDSKGGVTPDDCAAWLRSSLVQSESSERILSLSDSGPSARLDLVITEMTPGNAFIRIMIAEFGAGHAWVTVEGRVVDPASATSLVTFSDRRHDSGAIGFRDLAGGAGPAMVRGMLEAIARDLKHELQERFAPND